MDENEKEALEEAEVVSEVVEETPKKKEDDFVIPLPDSEKPKELPPNKKPFITLRLAGGAIDVCLIFLSTIGLNQLFMLTPMGTAINSYQNDMAVLSDEYKLKPLIEGSVETYGHKLYENEEKYTEYTTANYLVHDADESGYKYVVVKNDEVSEEITKAYNNALKNDVDYKNASFNVSLISFGMTALSAVIAETVFVLAIPLVNKRRATLGKLAAGTQLIDNKYQTPPKWYQMVGRFFWIYLVETILPYLIITNMLLVILIVPTLLFIITLFNKKGRTLHDFISRTMAIDKRTYLPIDKQ